MGTCDRGLSEKRTTSQQRTPFLYSSPLTSKKRTIFGPKVSFTRRLHCTVEALTYGCWRVHEAMLIIRHCRFLQILHPTNSTQQSSIMALPSGNNHKRKEKVSPLANVSGTMGTAIKRCHPPDFVVFPSRLLICRFFPPRRVCMFSPCLSLVTGRGIATRKQELQGTHLEGKTTTLNQPHI